MKKHASLFCITKDFLLCFLNHAKLKCLTQESLLHQNLNNPMYFVLSRTRLESLRQEMKNTLAYFFRD
jgi:hypothetical protein